MRFTPTMAIRRYLAVLLVCCLLVEAGSAYPVPGRPLRATSLISTTQGLSLRAQAFWGRRFSTKPNGVAFSKKTAFALFQGSLAYTQTGGQVPAMQYSGLSVDHLLWALVIAGVLFHKQIFHSRIKFKLQRVVSHTGRMLKKRWPFGEKTTFKLLVGVSVLFTVGFFAMRTGGVPLFHPLDQFQQISVAEHLTLFSLAGSLFIGIFMFFMAFSLELMAVLFSVRAPVYRKAIVGFGVPGAYAIFYAFFIVHSLLSGGAVPGGFLSFLSVFTTAGWGIYYSRKLYREHIASSLSGRSISIRWNYVGRRTYFLPRLDQSAVGLAIFDVSLRAIAWLGGMKGDWTEDAVAGKIGHLIFQAGLIFILIDHIASTLDRLRIPGRYQSLQSRLLNHGRRLVIAGVLANTVILLGGGLLAALSTEKMAYSIFRMDWLMGHRVRFDFSELFLMVGVDFLVKAYILGLLFGTDENKDRGDDSLRGGGGPSARFRFVFPSAKWGSPSASPLPHKVLVQAS